MSTPSAKRRLNFGSRSAKRPRRGDVYVMRGPKSEMKYHTQTITYSAATAANFKINSIAASASSNGRIGSKVKIHYIEAVLAQAAGNNSVVRCDLLIPNDASTLPAHAFDDPVQRVDNSLLKTQFMSGGTVNHHQGCIWGHKLPYGVVSRFGDSGSGNCNSNAIVARITTPVNATITGYFRVWYTDA